MTDSVHRNLDEQIVQLLGEHHLLTAPDLQVKLETFGKRYNKTSVYRALERLLEKDQVCRLSFSSNEILYELRDSHHDHLVCERCGRVQTTHCMVSIPDTDTFKATHHHLTVFGICDQCEKL